MSDIDIDVDEEYEEAKTLLEETTIDSVGGESATLGELLRDIKTAHKELDGYKSGSLLLSQDLDERKEQAVADGDIVLAQLLQDMKHSAFAVHLRLQRGDLELMGKRDGEYSGYFQEDGN